jgi:O-antigen/teichoic acid export membrane protein
MILASETLSVWVGRFYADYGYLLIILATGSTIDVAQWPASFVLQGMGKHRKLAFISLAIAIVSVILSVALAPVHGLAGVALGTLIPTVLGSFMLTLPYTLRILDLSFRETLFSAYRVPVLAALVASGIGFILAYIVQPKSLESVAAVAITIVGTYCSVYLYVAAESPECILCREYVMGGWSSLQRRLFG